MAAMKTSVVLLLVAVMAVAADTDSMSIALAKHGWFDLRDAVAAVKSPPFYRLITAAAFNDVRGAEKEIPAVMHSGLSPQQLGEVHYQLYRLYNRIGQYHNAVAEARKAWSIPEVGWTPSEAEKADADALERLPNLEVMSRRPAITSYSEWPGRATVVVPVAINGQWRARFGFDTGAGMCGMTETLAKRFGLRISAGQPLYDGMAGTQSTAGHYAIAERLKIGNTEFRNVSFLVLPDQLEVLHEIPADERGWIGLPIALALQTIRWNRSHRLDIGFAPARTTVRTSNLAFESLSPLIAVEVAGRRLSFEFDTGGEATTLWPPFAEEFPELLQDARKTSQKISGATGGVNLEAAILPELRMRLAGFPVVISDVSALRSPTVPASNFHHGLIGMDTLSKADEVTLDFRAMRLDLR
jgi:Aspartyl protease